MIINEHFCCNFFRLDRAVKELDEFLVNETDLEENPVFITAKTVLAEGRLQLV